MIKLVASDLDGTLLHNYQQTVPKEIYDTIKALHEKGIIFTAASGRQYANIRRLFAPLGFDIPYIAENGSMCVYKEEVLATGLTPSKTIRHILDKPVKKGERIPTEGELTELFEVGRSTVREAVKGLVTRGVLEVRRGDGTHVISTIYMENDVLGFGNVEDRYRLALDLFDVRLMIEPEIVTWACRKATDMMRWIGLMNNIRACADEIVLNDIVYS